MSNQIGGAQAHSFKAVGDIQLGFGFELPADVESHKNQSSAAPVAAKKKSKI